MANAITFNRQMKWDRKYRVYISVNLQLTNSSILYLETIEQVTFTATTKETFSFSVQMVWIHDSHRLYHITYNGVSIYGSATNTPTCLP